MKKKILVGFIGLLVVIQFFRIDKTNPEINKADDFIEINSPTEEIATMLKSSCYDCHSNESNYPWYSNVAPISWWVKDHINEGREELNFSKWSVYTEKKKDHKLEECVELVEEEEMPLTEYTWTHSEAKLSAEQRKELVDWFKATRKGAKTKKEKKTLQLNNGKKWAANPETTAGIERMLKIITQEIEEGRLSHYAAMGEGLNIEMKIIFDKCTMDGAAHEMLHLYLIPMVKMFRDLEEVGSEDEALILQKDIIKHLNNYNKFFISNN